MRNAVLKKEEIKKVLKAIDKYYEEIRKISKNNILFKSTFGSSCDDPSCLENEMIKELGKLEYEGLKK